MKKFEFPLDRVAKWSKQKLSVEQLGLLRTVKDLGELDQHLQNLRNQVTKGQASVQAQPVLTGFELQALAKFIRKLSDERERLQPARSQLLKKIEEQRQRVVAEHRRIRLFENLKDRRRADWSQALSKEEDALASDLFSAKLSRELRDTQTTSGKR